MTRSEMDLNKCLEAIPIPGVTLLNLSGRKLHIDLAALRKALSANPGAPIYAPYISVDASGVETIHPVDCFHEGSPRDDFNFGPALVIPRDILDKVLPQVRTDLPHAAVYDLILRLTEFSSPVMADDPIFRVMEHETTEQTVEDQFAYQLADRRTAQDQKQQVWLDALRRRGALLPAELPKVDFTAGGDFPVEMSVVIPVRNRRRTVADAVCSALSQNAPFDFNVIVVDNHSTDGTTALLQERFGSNGRVVLIIPEQTGLGIGGCWNRAVNDRRCGRFCVQLDSDDVYSTDDVLRRIHEEFLSTGAAMVVGSYRLTDRDMRPIGDTVIDHAEWQSGHGADNLLRVNGIGAPRAFFTPAIREVGFPDVSYGEDYGASLQLSGRHPVGRIYDVLYLCRRWEGNSDHSLSEQEIVEHNSYKDSLRAAELRRRKNTGR